VSERLSLLTGEDQSQADQPNSSLAEGPPMLVYIFFPETVRVSQFEYRDSFSDCAQARYFLTAFSCNLVILTVQILIL
jgi:hypothetical protein